MAKQPLTESSAGEIVEEFHVEDPEVSYSEITDKDDLPEGVTDAEEEVVPAKVAKDKPTDDDDIPEELKGKTPAQLAKMYREAQSVIGRQGSELGDLRSAADAYIKDKLAVRKAETPKPDTEREPDEVDFFGDPRSAVERAVANHPSIKALQGAQKEQAARDMVRFRKDAERTFTEQHPDAGEVLKDEGFREWVTKSEIRKAMLLRAHQHYDLNAANEVFNSWKELRDARKPAEPVKTEGKKVTAAKTPGRVPSSGNASPRTSGEGGKAGKIFRRADVVRLMENEPERYASMADEITQAYVDGRVR